MHAPEHKDQFGIWMETQTDAAAVLLRYATYCIMYVIDDGTATIIIEVIC